MKKRYSKTIQVPVMVSVEIQVEYEQDMEDPRLVDDCGVDMSTRHVMVKYVRGDMQQVAEQARARVKRDGMLNAMMPEVREHAAREELFKGYSARMEIEYIWKYNGEEQSCTCSRCVTNTIMGYAIHVTHDESGDVLGTLRCTAARAIPDMYVQARKMCHKDYSKRNRTDG